MADLHTRLVEAITARLNLAERAARYGLDRWRFDATSGTGPLLLVGPGEDDIWIREVNTTVWTCTDEQDGCPDEARGWAAEGKHIAANDPAFVIGASRADLELLEQHWHDENGDCRVCCGEADMVVEWDAEADEESVEWVRRPTRSPCGIVRNRAGVYGVNLDEQEG